ncbi:PEP-CTERM system histidine kinase PrsK [Photobacterium gaetbulicola]|uniref:histidine kinase n=1 Tax=Photobacterium gaetbulicola Gung47 TaxID=658445 RepID=A0A0C5WVE1_9GAMM|nr:XrtA/PEP-CTERM system histidine kinase PrsK [Photobacterium gaetbulicola]AJR09039.1 putative sensor histidine kinase [Photobacterium gaetbulicola Gung47]PSU04841.1 PEP-CTERM system histidine kinase PrsK [Photobacterium gaetbulicola]
MLEQLGSIGYFIGAGGFAFLFVLLLPTYNQKSIPKNLLLLSCLNGCLWAMASGFKVPYGYSILPSLLAETLFNLAITLLVISTIVNSTYIKSFFQNRLYWLSGTIAFMALLEISRFFYPLLNQKIFFLLHLVQATIGLWLVESLYRHHHPSSLYQAIKPLCLGLGLLFGYNFAFYADAFLTNTLANTFWQGRGWLITASIPFIALASRRIRRWESRVYISRDIVFHSTLSLAAGLYLLMMSIAGYYIKSVGSDWANVAQTLFFSFSGLLLAGLFFSEPLRKQLKVFITKHFFANKYEYRQEWMTFYTVMKDNQQSPYKRALKAIIGPFGCDCGVLAIRQQGTFTMVANINCDPEDSNIGRQIDSLATPLIENNWISELDKLVTGKENPPFPVNRTQIPNECHLPLMIPLSSRDGFQGIFLLSQPRSTNSINWEDRDLMKALSSEISLYLTIYEANKILAISKQFDTFNKMSSFLVHDLKNVLTQLQLLNRNAPRHKNNPEFIDDAFDTVESATRRLASVLNQLQHKRIEPEQCEWFDLTKVIEEACAMRSIQSPIPYFEHDHSQSISLKANRERVKNVLNHLLQNAQDATSHNGKVSISLQLMAEHFTIVISDTGHGMSEAFINDRLFKPFDSTKGNAGMGLGAYDAKLLVEQMKGSIKVKSAISEGTSIVLSFPINQAASITRGKTWTHC